MSNAMTVRLAFIAAAVLGTLALTQAAGPAAPPSAPRFETIPFELAEWTGVDAPPLPEEIAETLAADEYVHRYYEGPGGIVEMDVAYYGQPRVGSNMHSPLNCLPGTGWEISDVRERTITSIAGTWPVREMIVARGADRFAMTYWYQSRYRIIGEELRARVHLLGDALRRRPTDGSIVRLMMPAAGPVEAQRTTMAAFAEALMPELARRLR